MKDRMRLLMLPSSSRGLGFGLALVSIIGLNTQAQAQKVHNTYGTPLDTIKNTHLWTDVPQAKGFVRETSPDKKDLDYTPLTGAEPDRPKPRDLKGVEALQAELEGARVTNEKKAKGLLSKKTVSRPSKTVRAAETSMSR